MVNKVKEIIKEIIKIEKVLVLLFIIVMMNYYHGASTCEDGTELYECSSTHPGKYCTGGPNNEPVLKDYADKCGCPEGYKLVHDTAAPLGRCDPIGGQEAQQEDQSEQNDQEQQYQQSQSGEEQEEQEGTGEQGQGTSMTQNVSNMSTETQTTTDTETQTENKGNDFKPYEKQYVFEPIEAEETQVCPLTIMMILLILLMAAVV